MTHLNNQTESTEPSDISIPLIISNEEEESKSKFPPFTYNDHHYIFKSKIDHIFLNLSRRTEKIP